MSWKTNKEKKINKKISNKKGLCYSVITLLLIATLIMGLSYAWFTNKTDMATLLQVKGPEDIAILGPGASKLAALDLSYTNADKTGNTVTIKRIICVQGPADKYKLEIVHTTNLKGLTFQLYPAHEADKSESGTPVTDGGIAYKYDSAAINGSYINKKNVSSDYKYAVDSGDGNSKHSYNYGTYKNVQTHAEPIYWLTDETCTADETNDVMIDDKNNHRTYYVCEISWTDTSKETDIFYILAKTVN